MENSHILQSGKMLNFRWLSGKIGFWCSLNFFKEFRKKTRIYHGLKKSLIDLPVLLSNNYDLIFYSSV